MKEKTENILLGCFALIVIAGFLFCTAYGAVTLFQDLVDIR